MRFFVMFVTAVCVLFLIKLRWPKKKNFYELSKADQRLANMGSSYFIYGNCYGLRIFLMCCFEVYKNVGEKLAHPLRIGRILSLFARLIRRTYLILLCTWRRKKNQQPSEIQLHYEYLKYRASGGLEHLISQHPLWRLKVVLPPLCVK